MSKRNALILVLVVLIVGAYVLLNKGGGLTPSNEDDGIIVNVSSGEQVGTGDAGGAVLHPPALP